MRALLSVYDKTHLVDFARALQSLGWELIASGGTARALSDGGLPVTTVEAYTGSPEVLGGRVKTLHPAIHGGILARSSAEDTADLQRIRTAPIDIVVSNLYPFEQTIARPGVAEADAIEQIDIGGVALTRGYALSDAVRAVSAAQREIGMPSSVTGSYAGDAAEFAKSLTGEPPPASSPRPRGARTPR